MVREIISAIERRRRWPAEDKLRILSEALEEGAVVAAVADRNGVCRSLLYTWLRLARDSRLPGLSMARHPPAPSAAAAFVPVRIEQPVQPEPVAAASSPARTRSRPLLQRGTAIVEIALTNGRSLKVDEGIDPQALARLLEVLDEGARPRHDGSR